MNTELATTQEDMLNIKKKIHQVRLLGFQIKS